jgi:hypothetical protein
MLDMIIKLLETKRIHSSRLTIQLPSARSTRVLLSARSPLVAMPRDASA